MLHPKMVRVYLNNRPMHVLRKVKGHYAVRGWLGITRGWSVAREEQPCDLLVFEKGHEFAEGDRYVTENGIFPELPEEGDPPERQRPTLSEFN